FFHILFIEYKVNIHFFLYILMFMFSTTLITLAPSLIQEFLEWNYRGNLKYSITRYSNQI
ncbi:hypothetical protein L9F63_012249, partial [Diploptera punctata]